MHAVMELYNQPGIRNHRTVGGKAQVMTHKSGGDFLRERFQVESFSPAQYVISQTLISQMSWNLHLN